MKDECFYNKLRFCFHRWAVIEIYQIYSCWFMCICLKHASACSARTIYSTSLASWDMTYWIMAFYEIILNGRAFDLMHLSLAVFNRSDFLLPFYWMTAVLLEWHSFVGVHGCLVWKHCHRHWLDLSMVRVCVCVCASMWKWRFIMMTAEIRCFSVSKHMHFEWREMIEGLWWSRRLAFILLAGPLFKLNAV